MEVFRNPDLTAPAFTTVVPDIINIWGMGGPRADLTDHFSIRWTGQFAAPAAVVEKFVVDSDEGVRLCIDGQLLLDSWEQRGTQWQQSSLPFTTTRGVSYQVTMEYRDFTGFATAVLYWAGEGFIAPVSGFRHRPDSADTPPPVITLTGPNPILRADNNPTPFTVTISPSESPTGFTIEDIVRAGCFPDSSQPEPLVLGSDGRYSLYLVTSAASVSVPVATGSCTDAAGNPNAPSMDYIATTQIGDFTAPVLTLELPAEIPTDARDTRFTVRITPSEPVTGLTAADFALTGCRLIPNRGPDPIGLGSDGKIAHEASLQFPLSVSAAEDAAAASSQVPAAWLTTVEALPDIGRSLQVSVGGTERTLGWTCVDGARDWLTAESSVDLLEWKTVPLADLITVPATPAGMTRFRLPLPAGAASAYYRLRAARGN